MHDVRPIGPEVERDVPANVGVTRGLTRRRWPAIVGAVLIVLVLLGAAAGLWWLSNLRGYQVAGKLVSHVDTHDPVVALTFDDGPVPERVEPLLALLREVDARATFFVIGEALAQSPESGRRLVEAGHELGNHSYTHQRMVFRSGDFYAREVEQTDAQIRAAGQRGEIVFRPPYGKKLFGLPFYLARTDRTTVTWGPEPESDPAIARSSDRIVADVLANVSKGSIILLHPWYDSGEPTRHAIVPIVRGLRARGFELVTVSELMAHSEMGQ
jgi:peptidoglycan-N-acetylglucosamine deacetylase